MRENKDIDRLTLHFLSDCLERLESVESILFTLRMNTREARALLDRGIELMSLITAGKTGPYTKNFFKIYETVVLNFYLNNISLMEDPIFYINKMIDITEEEYRREKGLGVN
jgi:hypothetical protein